MHSLIPYIRRSGGTFTPQQLRNIENELNALDALRKEHADLHTKYDALIASAPKGRKESAA